MLRSLILAALLASVTLTSQAYEVSATVTDSVGDGLPYATYRIYPAGSDNPLISNTTDVSGSFTQPVDSAGSYRLEFSYTGMATVDREFSLDASTPVVNLGNISMAESATQLEGLTVTAQRPLVIRQIDRIGYDVQADPERPTVMVNDILRKVPLVSVDPDGTIKVNGSTNFKIYKNGRPNNSMSRNAKDLFAAMPASMIKRIEVITEPGAEYDAEGTTAILNIITEDNTSIKGVLGTVAAHWDTNSDAPMANAWMTTEIDKLTFNIYGGYQNLSGRRMRSERYEEIIYPDGSQRTSSSSERSKGNICYFGFDGSLQLDTLNLFTAEINGYTYDANSKGNSVNPAFDPAGNQVSNYSVYEDSPGIKYVDIDASFNYQHSTHRKGENITLSYMLSHTDQNNRINSYYNDVQGIDIPYSAILSKYKLSFFEHTFQGDWSRPFGDKHTLNLGVKGIFRRNHSINNFDYTGVGTVDDEFSHNTDIAAAYAQYSVKLKSVSLRAGLRYEYSHLKASYPDGSEPDFSANLSDLVPSAAVSWQVNDANSLSFNYATSISRPGISYLNPAVTISPYSLSYGNPDLGSARRQSMKLNYMLIKPKVTLQFNVNYDLTNNGVASVKFLDDNNLINTTYANIGHLRNLGFSLYTQWSVTSKTTFMINASARWQHASQSGMRLSRWSPNIYAQLRQSLPWGVQGEVFAYYSDGWLNGVYGYTKESFSSALYYGLSLSRGFLKDKRLNIRLSLNNPISSSRARFCTYTVNGDFTGRTDDIRPSGIAFRVTVSYRFGSLQAQVKKTATSIENDDLVGRK
ncbi:MAG: TonB-dependent receptor family protein [Odoribacter sp.]|nr:TonB-dependent receptor family protein [Odoribacter sp.]